MSNGAVHVFFNGAQRKPEPNRNFLKRKLLEPPQHEYRTGYLGQFQQDHADDLQRFAAKDDPVGTEFRLCMQLRFQGNVPIKQPYLATAASVLEDARCRLEDVAVKMIDLAALAASHDAQKYFLDEIVNILCAANMTLEETSECAAQSLRSL